MTELHFKPAEARDTPLLLGLIRELTEAEEFPFPVTVTESDLRDSLFGPHPAAEALLCLSEGKVVGYAVFYETFATTTGKRGLHLDDLFILPEAQGNGFGRAFLRHLAEIATDRGCARFEWCVLKTNINAIRFYQSVGACPVDELLIFRTQDESLKKLTENAG